MLNKNHLISLLVVASVALTGCNSKKSSSSGTKKTGEVIFFQNIEGTGELQLKALKTNQRNSYGKVGFQQFTNAVSLPIGTWHVNVVNDNAANDADKNLIGEASFESKQNDLSLVAITEDSTDIKQLVQLPFASGGGIRPINIAHLHNGLGDLVAYFLLPDETTNECIANPDADPDAVITNSISFGEVSDTVDRKLPAADANDNVSRNVCVYIKDKDSADTLIYQSGKVSLESSANQTIIITRNTVAASGDPEAVNLIYYRNGVSLTWSNSPDDTKANVRVLNLLDTVLEDVKFSDIEANPSVVVGDINSLGLSKFDDGLLGSNKAYFVEAKMMPNPMVTPFSGQQSTVMFYGNPSAGQAVITYIVQEPLNTVNDKVQLTISTPVKLASGEVSNFAIYLLEEGNFEFNSPLVTVGARTSTTVTLDPKNYHLYVMDASGSYLVRLAQYTGLNWASLSDDEKENGINEHIVLYKPAGGGFDLCLINDQACQ